VGSAPNWVKELDFPVEPVSVKPSQMHLQQLLFDKQKNKEEQTSFYHYVMKVISPTGIQYISKISVDVDPSHSRVVVHKIRIFRNGEWHDRLGSARSQIIQREADLDYNIYNGDLSLVYFLNDVREGDIVDYSYSRIGENPVFSSHYADTLAFQKPYTIEKISHRLIANSDCVFSTKSTGISIEPKVTDLPDGLREWTWEALETPPSSYEENQPSWDYDLANIQVSQFKSWQEVARKIAPLYSLPANFESETYQEMKSHVKKWEDSSRSSTEKALLALRFVQDEVRYLGFEEGVGAFKPRDPLEVFHRRFGDCKDKAYLLHALLRLMGIRSVPMLVHSNMGKKIPEMLPSPFAFDHAVLQIEIDGICYWVDPTLRLQGGSLQENFFPDYEWGLLLSDETTALNSLPKAVMQEPTKIKTTYILQSEDHADLQMQITYHSSSANNMRCNLEKSGKEEMSKGYLQEIQKLYGSATLNSPLSVIDQREKNVFQMTESYRIPTSLDEEFKVLPVFPTTIRYYLEGKVNPERMTPFAIIFPKWVEEHIHVESPFINWEVGADELRIEHECMFFSRSEKYSAHECDWYFELKHLQDHVPKSSLRKYWEIINQLENGSILNLNVVSVKLEPINLSQVSFSAIFFPCLTLFVWPLLYFFSRKRRTTQDSIAYLLQKAWLFYALITPCFIGQWSSALSIWECVILVVLISVAWTFLRNFILEKRAMKAVIFMELFIGLQLIGISLLISLSNHSFRSIEVVWIGIGIWLYLGYSLKSLDQARRLLILERAARN
jgi:transglutaminase-like putative cysteine protease